MISPTFLKKLGKTSKFDYITGNYNELFYCTHTIKTVLFGPFRCNTIEKDKFYSMVQYKSIKHSDKESLYKIIK